MGRPADVYYPVTNYECIQKVFDKRPHLPASIKVSKENIKRIREGLTEEQDNLLYDKWELVREVMGDSDLEDHEPTRKRRAAMEEL